MGFQVTFKDIAEILLVAILLYQTYKLLKRTGAANIFVGIMIFLICWFFVSYIFKMELLRSIFDTVINVGAFALIVLFQDEIRSFLSKLGSKQNWGILNSIKKLFSDSNLSKDKTDFEIVQIVLACRNLSKNSTGGLIVITRSNDLDFYIQSGEQINAAINSRLIENIFFKNSPLHDGAMIVSKSKIKAVACILPVSKNQTIPKRLGLRHRAALGITEHTDALAIVISEETGHISLAINGQLTANIKPEQLEYTLSLELSK